WTSNFRGEFHVWNLFPPMDCVIPELRSIRQNVQSGQFLTRCLAQRDSLLICLRMRYGSCESRAAKFEFRQIATIGIWMRPAIPAERTRIAVACNFGKTNPRSYGRRFWPNEPEMPEEKAFGQTNPRKRIVLAERTCG